MSRRVYWGNSLFWRLIPPPLCVLSRESSCTGERYLKLDKRLELKKSCDSVLGRLGACKKPKTLMKVRFAQPVLICHDQFLLLRCYWNSPIHPDLSRSVFF